MSTTESTKPQANRKKMPFASPRKSSRTMWIFGVIVAAAALLGSCGCAPAAPPPAAGMVRQPGTGTVAYGTGAGQNIRVVQKGTPGKPVLMSVVGGGYHGLNTGVTPMLAGYLPGWRVLQVRYVPGSVDNVEAQVQAAINWAAANPAWVGANPANLRVAGESAGGQAATRAVLRNSKYTSTKVYSLAGTTELDVWNNRWAGQSISETIKQVSGCSNVTWSACVTVRDASPASHARPGPRLFFIHGQADGMVPPQMGGWSAQRYPYAATSLVVGGNHLDASFLKEAARSIT